MPDYTTYSDIELTDLLKAGKHGAFAEIYNRYIFTLLNHANNKLYDREEAKDVVHEVFTMLWSKRGSLQITNLSGYLYTSVRNIILNQIAHKSVRDKYILSMAHFSEQGSIKTDHLIREHQLSELIEKEIAALPVKMRNVFELNRKKHLSHREISIELNISEQTVSKHITNALRILRTKFGLYLYLCWFFHR
ncbi:RNA polymerase sigma-70 factor (ECF subfamily) [Chitinophaga niastensis]|uniref:RNA polymerase sigma-70 factor (ECF subfamily) n=1 Tax=Chitinophaga niastensis TaxID=536980 RepID=A0A2P8HGS8_CHINA|nr:RNA polymerase sigma-70 factor [Chitinophaga niastensis]PSL45415.1 RNA polymerase sigma-70 factor (ECF subfamily) [Chitinophaga niastensis]